VPSSHPEGREWAADRIADTTAPIIIDIGCGEGTYSDIARELRPDALWIGVDIWPQYVDEFKLWHKYDFVVTRDARDLAFPFAPYVLLAGDVLEHMRRSESVALLQRAKLNAQAIMVSVPIIDYPQHAHPDGNPYEAHVDQWSHDDMLAELDNCDSWVGDVVGRYWWTPQWWV